MKQKERKEVKKKPQTGKVKVKSEYQKEKDRKGEVIFGTNTNTKT